MNDQDNRIIEQAELGYFFFSTHRQKAYYQAKIRMSSPRIFFLISLLVATAQSFAPIVPSSTLNTASTSAIRRTAAASTALNVAIDTSDIKNGLTIELDGEPYKVMSFSIMKQARGAAKTTIKFKNLMKGNTIENTYRSGEKFETAMIEKKSAQSTYNDEVRLSFCFV
jgi:hypothetical protein